MDNHETSAKIIIVITTETNLAKAKVLARELLEQKLVACVSFNEIYSCFWWDEKIESNNEVQLLLKTNKKKIKRLIEVIGDIHSYDVPELIYWEASASSPYKLWMDSIF